MQFILNFFHFQKYSVFVIQVLYLLYFSIAIAWYFKVRHEIGCQYNRIKPTTDMAKTTNITFIKIRYIKTISDRPAGQSVHDRRWVVQSHISFMEWRLQQLYKERKSLIP